MKYIIATLLLLGALNTNAMDFGIGAEVGTLGYGGTVTLQLNDRYQTRIKATTLSVTFNETIQGYDVKYNIDDWSFSFLFDIYPTKKSFRFSLGAVSMADVYITSTPRNTTTFLERAHQTKADFDLAPYIGIGFGSTNHRRVSAQMDIGIAFQSYSIDFTDNSYFIPAPNNNTQNEITDKLDFLKIYPVISLSIVYGF